MRMTETVDPDAPTPVYVIDKLEDVYKVIAAWGEHGAVIADFRAVQDPARRRVVDMLQGAAVARGNSPLSLGKGVYFLFKDGRFPKDGELARYRNEE